MAQFCQENQLLSVSKPSECPRGAHHLTTRLQLHRPFSTIGHADIKRAHTRTKKEKTHTHRNTKWKHTKNKPFSALMWLISRKHTTTNTYIFVPVTWARDNVRFYIEDGKNISESMRRGTQDICHKGKIYLYIEALFKTRQSRKLRCSLNCIFQLIFNQCQTVNQQLTEWPLNTTDRVSLRLLSVFLPPSLTLTCQHMKAWK